MDKNDKPSQENSSSGQGNNARKEHPQSNKAGVLPAVIGGALVGNIFAPGIGGAIVGALLAGVLAEKFKKGGE